MHTITRTFEFDYGHRVLGHTGKCRTPHGHRGKAEITLTAESLDDLSMVLDFTKVKDFVGRWIENAWDHAFLIHADDPLRGALEQDQGQSGGKIYVMPRGENPTAEVMAKDLFEIAIALLDRKVTILSVTIWETPSCAATFSCEF